MPESVYFFFKRWNLFTLFRLYYVHADSTLINYLFVCHGKMFRGRDCKKPEEYIHTTGASLAALLRQVYQVKL